MMFQHHTIDYLKINFRNLFSNDKTSKIELIHLLDEAWRSILFLLV